MNEEEIRFDFKIEEKGILINGLFIQDEKLVEFLKEKLEAQMDKKSVKKYMLDLLQLGQIASNSLTVTDHTNYVDEKFSNLSLSFDQIMKENVINTITEKINNQIGKDSEFAKSLEEKFGKEGNYQSIIDDVTGQYEESFKTLLDFNNKNSPFSKLQEQIEENQKDMLDKFSKLKIFKDEEKKGTQKGINFENDLIPILQDIAEGSPYNFEATGTITGLTGKKGDFVFKSDTNKLVLEAKVLENISEKKVIDELDRGIENREANFGIMIHLQENDEEIVPIGAFHTIDKNKLFISININDPFNYSIKFLKMAIKYAFTIMDLNNKESSDDGNALETLEKNIEKRLKQINDIKKASLTISKNSEKITSFSEKIIDSIEEDLKLFCQQDE